MKGSVFDNTVLTNAFQIAHFTNNAEEMKHLIETNEFSVLDILLFEGRNGKRFDSKKLFDLISLCLKLRPDSASHVHRIRDNMERTALDFLTIGEIGSYDVFNLVVSHTSREILNRTSYTSVTPLFNTIASHAYMSGGIPDYILKRLKCLIEYGADVNTHCPVVQRDPMSFLQWILVYTPDPEDFVDYLILKGAKTKGIDHPFIHKRNRCKKVIAGVFLMGILSKDLARYVLAPAIWSTRLNEKWL